MPCPGFVLALLLGMFYGLPVFCQTTRLKTDNIVLSRVSGTLRQFVDSTALPWDASAEAFPITLLHLLLGLQNPREPSVLFFFSPSSFLRPRPRCIRRLMIDQMPSPAQGSQCHAVCASLFLSLFPISSGVTAFPRLFEPSNRLN